MVHPIFPFHKITKAYSFTCEHIGQNLKEYSNYVVTIYKKK